MGALVEGNGKKADEGFDWKLEAADLLAVLRDAVIIADAAENRIVGWNPAAEQIFGYPLDEAIGMSVSELAPERLKARHEAGLARYAQTGTGHFLDNHDPLELPALTKSGDEIVVEFQLTPIRESRDGRLYAAAIVRDVTDRIREAESQRKLQESTAASQRLEAVGQLATGVAHDFNNLLMVIIGGIDLLLDAEGLSPDERASLRSILGAAERGTSLSHQLLAFARKSVITPQAVSLNEAINSAAHFLELTLGEGIELELQLDEELPRTMMDAGQIDQVLMNFALNAKDAMPKGGTLTIRTDVRKLPDEAENETQEQLPPGVYVRVSISDTGTGMDEETRRRIFEPFFTTKARERGTGMGLAMVYGVVTQAEGYIQSTSALGEGTTFEILLPAASVTADKAEEARELSSVLSRQGSILLVDDDPALLRVVTQILERGGHSVVTSSSPAEALEIAKAQGPFDVLVSDVVMPGMNGVDLARQLRDAGDVHAVILMSGYPESSVPISTMLEKDHFPLLQKPFTRDQILQQVAASMNDSPPNPE